MENNLLSIHTRAIEILQLKIAQEELLCQEKEKIDLWNVKGRLCDVNVIRETYTLEELEWDVKVRVRKIGFINRAYQKICGQLCKVEESKPVCLKEGNVMVYNVNQPLLPLLQEVLNKHEKIFHDQFGLPKGWDDPIVYKNAGLNKPVNTQEEVDDCIKKQLDGRWVGFM